MVASFVLYVHHLDYVGRNMHLQHVNRNRGMDAEDKEFSCPCASTDPAGGLFGAEDGLRAVPTPLGTGLEFNEFLVRIRFVGRRRLRTSFPGYQNYFYTGSLDIK